MRELARSWHGIIARGFDTVGIGLRFDVDAWLKGWLREVTIVGLSVCYSYLEWLSNPVSISF